MQSQIRRIQGLRGQIQSQLCRTGPAANISYASQKIAHFRCVPVKRNRLRRFQSYQEVQDSLENVSEGKTENTFTQEYDINSTLL